MNVNLITQLVELGAALFLLFSQLFQHFQLKKIDKKVKKTVEWHTAISERATEATVSVAELDF